jgi:spoIIIJ-associated protein
MSNSELQAAVLADIEELRDMLKAEAEVSVEVVDAEENDRQVVNIRFDGDELGYMIGSKGRHLSSLQFIVSMIINKKYSDDTTSRVYVNVDVSGYRQERADKVEEIAMRAADDARILGESIDMDPMSASERRIVHMVLEKFDDITTESFGEGPDRAVRITPTSEEDLGLMVDLGEGEEEESEE